MAEEAVGRFRTTIGEGQWERLLGRLQELNRQISARGIQRYREWDLLTGYDCGEFWDWDLYFENLYLSYYGIHRYCRTNLERFLDAQLDNGFIGRRLLHPTLAARDHFKPFLAQIAVLACRQSGDCRWLIGHYYERLQRYLDYWFWFCDYDKNGLPVWDSAGHTGMDNQFRRAGNEGSTWCEGVDLACYLVRELQAMAVLDGLLGLGEEKERHLSHAGTLSALINNVFWHEEDGFYYDRNERTGALIMVKAVSSFVPLWLGLPSPDRAARLIGEHLLNKGEFWLTYPVATWAKSEPDYYQHRLGQECSWRGATWIPTNYMVFQGLRRYGYAEAARELAYRTFDLVLAENDTREFYDAETGAGQGRNPFWGWSSLAYVMPLEYESGYDPTTLEASPLRPLVRELLGVSFP